MYGEGISKIGEIVDLGVKFDILKKSGAWFYYGEQRLGQGRENVKLLFKQETELANEIEQQIRAKMKEALDSKKGAAAPIQQPEVVKIPTTKAAARATLDIAVDDDE